MNLTQTQEQISRRRSRCPRAPAFGTVDALTATFYPPLELEDEPLCAIVATGANTSTVPTFAPSELAPYPITTRGGQRLGLGDIGPAGYVALLLFNATTLTWELLNPCGGGAFLPFRDLFNGVAALNQHRSDSGLTYSAVSSSAILGDGMLRMNSAAAFVFVDIGPPFPTPDAYVEVIATSDGWATYDNGALGIIMRDNGADSYYSLFVFAPSVARGADYTYTFSKWVSGVETVLYSQVATGLSLGEGDPFTTRLTLEGTTVTLTIETVEMFSITDADVPDNGAARFYLMGGDPDPGQEHFSLLSVTADGL